MRTQSTLPGEYSGSSGGWPFQAVIEQLRSGDPIASEYVWSRYAGKLASRAQNELFDATRRQKDPDDIIQSVFKSFLRNIRSNGFGDLDSDEADWKNLWSLLATMVRYKCWNANNKCFDRGHGQLREIPLSAQVQLDATGAAAFGDGDAEWHETLSLVKQVVSDWPDLQSTIALRLLEGAAPRQIAEMENCSRRTAERVREKLRNCLMEYLTWEDQKNVDA